MKTYLNPTKKRSKLVKNEKVHKLIIEISINFIEFISRFTRKSRVRLDQDRKLWKLTTDALKQVQSQSWSTGKTQIEPVEI